MRKYTDQVGKELLIESGSRSYHTSTRYSDEKKIDCCHVAHVLDRQSIQRMIAEYANGRVPFCSLCSF